MSQIKVVQLTERNPEAVWKTKQGFKKMVDMDDQHLQLALLVCQKRKLKLFMELLRDFKLEDELKHEAKKRGFELQDYDHIKVTMMGARYTEFEDLMNTVSEAIKRKARKIVKEENQL